MLIALLPAENAKIKDLSNRQQTRREQSASTGVPCPLFLPCAFEPRTPESPYNPPPPFTPAKLLVAHVCFQAQGSSCQRPTSLVQPGKKGPSPGRWTQGDKGPHNEGGIEQVVSDSHRALFQRKEAPSFWNTGSKPILSQHWGVCYSTQVLCHSPVFNERTVHLESCYKCLNQNT